MTYTVLSATLNSSIRTYHTIYQPLLSTLNAVEMLHDSVLYKCTIDIASWDVSRRVWFRLVAAAWLDVDEGRMDAAMKSESAVRVQPSESPVDYNNEHLSSDDCEHSHDDDRSTTQRCTGHSRHGR